jgi:hypothetical protein
MEIFKRLSRVLGCQETSQEPWHNRVRLLTALQKEIASQAPEGVRVMPKSWDSKMVTIIAPSEVPPEIATRQFIGIQPSADGIEVEALNDRFIIVDLRTANQIPVNDVSDNFFYGVLLERMPEDGPHEVMLHI